MARNVPYFCSLDFANKISILLVYTLQDFTKFIYILLKLSFLADFLLFLSVLLKVLLT